MVRFIINAGLTCMIALVLLIMPDFKSCVVAACILIAAFIGLNIAFDKDEVRTIR